MPLYQIFKDMQRNPHHFIEREDKFKSAFHQLKMALITAPALCLLIQDKFPLYIYEKRRLVLGQSADDYIKGHCPTSCTGM
jgi:hypothetical protein